MQATTRMAKIHIISCKNIALLSGAVLITLSYRYRKATVDDLGFENDGTFHHYLIQDSDHVKSFQNRTANGHPGLETRAEERAYGVMTDYFWQIGYTRTFLIFTTGSSSANSFCMYRNQDTYNQMHDSPDFKDMTRKIDSYMENNKQGVFCLTPIGKIGTHGSSSRFRVDNGIIAYGWNDKPYKFNGQAGNWPEGCKGNNI